MSLPIEKLLYDVREVSQATGLSETEIRRRVRDNNFPAPLDLGRRCTRWSVKDLHRWIAKQPRTRAASERDEDDIL